MEERRKIRFWDLIRNKDGKLSGSGTSGFLITSIGSISFLAIVVGAFIGLNEVTSLLDKVVLFTGIGASLLGIRKIQKG